jgi:two-component system chemotaxis response regulator CheY
MALIQGVSSMHSRPLEVFLVDDDRVSLQLMRAILTKQGYNVRVASDPIVALREIEKAPPNVLLTDWSMPGMNGGELCQAVRDMELPRYVFTIVLTANAQDFVVEALDAGADDFITKPVDPNELAARMNAGRRILDLEDRLKTLSERDSLTGILNRPTFFTQFERAFSAAQASGTELSVVMLDLDRFKSINDIYGHLAGDQVLQQVGSILSQAIDDEMFVGRYGGEEFIVGLPGRDERAAEALTYEIRDRLACQPFDFGASQEYHVSASFGVSGMDASFQKPAQLINSADQNLLTAKRLGRNRTVVGCFGRNSVSTQPAG